MFGNFNHFPLNLGGGKTPHQSLDDALKAGLGTSLGSDDTLLACERYAEAAVLAMMWQQNYLLERNAKPGTAYASIRQWAKDLGVAISESDRYAEIKRLCSLKFEVVENASEGELNETCRNVLGSLFKRIEYTAGTLDSPPAGTFWNNNFDGYYLSPRSKFRVIVDGYTGLSGDELAQVMNVKLANVLDFKLPDYVQWEWAFDVGPTFDSADKDAGLQAIVGGTYAHAYWAEDNAPGQLMTPFSNRFGGYATIAGSAANYSASGWNGTAGAYILTGSTEIRPHQLIALDTLGASNFCAIMAFRTTTIAANMYLFHLYKPTSGKLGVYVATDGYIYSVSNISSTQLGACPNNTNVLLAVSRQVSGNSLVKIYVSGASTVTATPTLTYVGSGYTQLSVCGYGTLSGVLNGRFKYFSLYYNTPTLTGTQLDAAVAYVQSKFNCPL